MLLCTPDLPIIIDSMENLNVSIFWTGYKRMNQTHFFERSTKLYAGCGSNAWTSPPNKTRAPQNICLSYWLKPLRHFENNSFVVLK